MAKEKADQANAEADEAKASDSDDQDASLATAGSDASSDDSGADDADDSDADEVTKADGPEAKKSASVHPPQLSHDDHAGDAHGDAHGLAHTMPVKGLIGVWAVLMLLTVLTVSATSFDLGYRMNLVVAMVIATVKASLVMLFFMHLWWDKRFNVVLFTGAFLFVALFIGLVVNDRSEYQIDINAYDDAKAQQ